MRLLELLDSAGYALPGDVENVEVTGVTSNSKAVLALDIALSARL